MRSKYLCREAREAEKLCREALQRSFAEKQREASTFAEEMGISLELSHPNPRCLKEDGTEVPNIKII